MNSTVEKYLGIDLKDPNLTTYRGLIRSMGYTDFDMSRPMIGVCNTWSELNPGHSHFRALADAVKRGIWAAGGFPLEFNTISMCELFHDISTLIYRNLMSIDTEEMLSSMPIKGVVLLSTCDKNVPAQMMALATVNKPAIILTGGTRLSGYYRGETVGCATDSYRFMYDYKAGLISDQEFEDIERNTMFNTCGACAVMGTANSAQAIAESLGLTLTGAASIPSVYAQRIHIAEATGIKIVELVKNNVRPSDILTRSAFENAIKVLMATGASTNMMIHMTAIARRAGISLTLDDFDRIGRETPFIANVKPCGKYTTEDLYHAGGIEGVMKEIEPLLDTSVLTVSNQTLRENLKNVRIKNRDVIHSMDHPLSSNGGLKILKGNLAPDGAVIKTAAASPKLLKHTGPAIVIPKIVPGESLKNVVEKTLTNISDNHVVINRYQGPVGAPGMPEVGEYGLSEYLLKKGVRDIVRVTDARMSGTAYGTIVLHVAPEAAVGGPLAAVQNGDLIELDAYFGKINLLVDDREIKRRLEDWKPDPPQYSTGYRSLWIDQVMQAPDGCDFLFNIDKNWRLAKS